jgi:HAD superfamily hydrolase (TIGR01509 family)
MEAVFDIGNVLLRWDPRHLYRKVFSDEAARERFLSSALAMSFVAETDIAPSFSAAIEARALAFPDDAAALRLFDARWSETLDGPIEENVALLRRLKAAGSRVHALSNFAHEKFALTAEVYPFLRMFDVAVISGHEGVAKPDRRIFELLAGRAPGELLFVDDSPGNIEAARAFGLEAVLYTPEVDLARVFVERGVAGA